MDVTFCLKYLFIDCILIIFVGRLTNSLQGACSKCNRFEMRKDMSCQVLLTTVRKTDMTTCMRHCTDDCQGLLYNEIDRTCSLCSSVKFETGNPAINARVYEKVCPPVKSNGYAGYKQPQTWQEARQLCDDKHAGLAVERNIEEYQSLKTSLQQAGLVENIWIGGNLVGSTWEWVAKGGQNMKMTYANWHPKEPNGNGKCLQLWYNYQFDDEKCELKKSFVCML